MVSQQLSGAKRNQISGKTLPKANRCDVVDFMRFYLFFCKDVFERHAVIGVCYETIQQCELTYTLKTWVAGLTYSLNTFSIISVIRR